MQLKAIEYRIVDRRIRDQYVQNMCDPKSSPVEQLKRLAAALKLEHWAESIVIVETAKIPLLKLVSCDSAVPIDITIESTNTHSGLLAR
jgi:non-canonical poly(A) RNA polymerase PAPD5/7